MTFEEFKATLNETEREMLAYFKDLAEANRFVNILEVGSGWGIFARIILEFSEDGKLTTIDKIPTLETFDKNVQGFEDRITRMNMESVKALTGFPHGSFDLIFIDGSHNAGDVLNDLRLAWPLVADGGFMIIDDCLHKHNWDGQYGVMHDIGLFLRNRMADHEIVHARIDSTANGYVRMFKALSNTAMNEKLEKMADNLRERIDHSGYAKGHFGLCKNKECYNQRREKSAFCGDCSAKNGSKQ